MNRKILTVMPMQSPRQQRGLVLMLMLIVLVIGVTAVLVNSLSGTGVQNLRNKATTDALFKAKTALIGYAVSVNLSNPSSAIRPGDLPCPDTNDDGASDTPCNTNALGHLPWKTLGLPELFDGDGEHLWYAVSSNFKNNNRTTCSSAGAAGCLNSDTLGTISLFAADGTRLNDGGSTGSGSTGLVAVVIAPGAPLIRSDASSMQNRSNKNTASNYLDVMTIASSTFDNASFVDASSTQGFIQGPIKNSSGKTIVNDQVLGISQSELMQVVQKRVAGEVENCLVAYADPANGGNTRYPWPAKITAGSGSPSYADSTNELFGRIPDTPFSNTKTTGGTQMKDVWTGNCNINSASGWWLNWKDMVFYGIASSFKPQNENDPASCGTCLSVAGSNAAKFVVVVAGKTLSTQSPRTSNTAKNNLANYLESTNPNGMSSGFVQGSFTPTFNDTVVFQ